MSEPRFFRSAKEWRAWLEKNHAKADALVLGFHKTGTDKAAFNYKQAVDEALCFGWIDGRSKGGEATWSVRFTPRKAKSIWSQVNIRRIEELKTEGRVHPTGLATYDGRDPKLQHRYSHENPHVGLPPEFDAVFRRNKKAWTWFEKMPMSYRRPAIWWVTSAKQEATRVRRLDTLIADSAEGRKVKLLRRPGDQ